MKRSIIGQGLVLLATLSMATAGCFSAPTPHPANPDAGPTQPDTPAVDPPVLTDPVDEEFQAALGEVIDESKAMTISQFVDKYTPPDAPKAPLLSFDPTTATYFDMVDEVFKLNEAEMDALKTNGFMVSERLSWPTMAEALLEVYQKDLPILVTTDMILQALHSSYDEILKRMELSVLYDTLNQTLSQAHAGLGALDMGDSTLAGEARRDVDFYLTTARRLLTDEAVPSALGEATDTLVAQFLEHIGSEQMRTVEIFGVQRTNMDFSQFKPRGHYEDDPKLQRYFKAMMWLGRIDFRFAEFNPFTAEWIFHHRQLVGAHALQRLTADDTTMALWNRANDLITMMVGPVDYIDFRGVMRMNDEYGWTSVADVAGLDQAAQDDVLAKLLTGAFGEQLINSHWLETNPFSAEPTPLPPSFAFLGQRFVVDSYVFANVVYDNIVSEETKEPRVLPDPLDALFVLGNDQVLPHLQEELQRYKYQGNLNTLRYLVDDYDEAFWSSNIYNLWLDAIRELNAPTTGEGYPAAMKSSAWRDRVINTQLGSWAQLRHDTLLYAKQSYTGGVACEHPDGYVEPYPGFFAKLKTLGQIADQTLANVDFGTDAWMGESLKSFFTNWVDIMGKLEGMAAKSLANEAYTADEIEFIKSTIMADPGCGEPVFSGWYTSLYISGDPSDWKPTIADVHTNPNQGPLPGPNVLHVATGNANLMVLTTETCDGAEAFVGPVFSYYEVDVPEIKRLSDSEWKETITTGDMPVRPEWTSSFLVPMTP